jgi:flagellar motor switch/type III secretory pathway protein FliN
MVPAEDNAEVASATQDPSTVHDDTDAGDQSTRDEPESDNTRPEDTETKPYVLDDLKLVTSGGDTADETTHAAANSLRIELGRTHVRRDDMRGWNPGSVIVLNAASHSPVDVYFANRLVAQGELVTRHDRLAVKLTHLLHARGRSDAK